MRSNLVPPSELTDQHLVAEWNETFMFVSALNRTLNSKKGLDCRKIPTKFTLNKGHGYFFYNKGKYLARRYEMIRTEMLKRGFKPDPSRVFPREKWPDYLWGDWTPSPEDVVISRKRIEEKIAMKPAWYRKTPYIS